MNQDRFRILGSAKKQTAFVLLRGTAFRSKGDHSANIWVRVDAIHSIEPDIIEPAPRTLVHCSYDDCVKVYTFDGSVDDFMGLLSDALDAIN